MSRATNTDIHPTKLFDEKMNFIRENFPEYKNCDPYQDFYLIEKIKMSMINAGLYRQKYAASNPNINAAIIRLIRKARGEKVLNRIGKGK